MEVAQNARGKKVYLLAQSYMPAQDIQILANPNNPKLSPWYELDDGDYNVVTPQWILRTSQLMRFPTE